LDRYIVHRKTVRLLRREHPNWFLVEWFPSYAPDLNPVEGVWNHSKYSDLANFIPADVQHLCRELVGSLNTQKCKPELILSYFKHAKLEL
jgi:putative transposase